MDRNNSSGLVGAESCTKQEGMEHQYIKRVHIGVFFDGTSNNAVQQAIFHKYKNSRKGLADKEKIKQFRDAQRLKERKKEKLDEQAVYTAMLSNTYCDYIEISRKLYEVNLELKQIDSELSKINLQPNFNLQYMRNEKEKGYSNIAILYGLLASQENNDDDIYYNIYVEGSGATDITNKNESNINGLGFGLGKTGVTALVSKAVRAVHDYINSNKPKLSWDTNYHFYVFGFSRGATCARLFSELVVRGGNDKLKRESEFSENTSYAKNLVDKNGRLSFMDKDSIGYNLIDTKKVSVDFLGIFDTVASIGFLKQKDGWTNSLSWGYRSFWWNNYNGNFHYMNAHDYGLYSPQNKKVKCTIHICAADEFRENFALVNLGSDLQGKNTEIIIPGCHSDIGGGFVDGVDMDVVLYKFIPRKLEHFIKSNKITEIIGYPFLRYLKERATVFLNKPYIENSHTEDLSPDSLAALGWIDKNWNKHNKIIVNHTETKNTDNIGQSYTKRVANWANEIKFKRFVLCGYSNIPLEMMIELIGKEKSGICQRLFNPGNNPYAVDKIPDFKLQCYGKSLVSFVKDKIVKGKRYWILPQGDYSSALYRYLRLRYLHFTASCEIAHFRTKYEGETDYKLGEVNAGNFGNNCNYDNNARICRITYMGDKDLKGDHSDNVLYMYNLNVEKIDI